MNSIKQRLLILLDQAWMAICVFFVKMAVVFSKTPVIGVFLRRLTFMSGSSDVNANLCLFLRTLYTHLPNGLAFDKKELELGSRFLQIQYKVAVWLIRMVGLRLLPPPLRPLYISYYGRAMEASKFIRKVILEKNVQQIVILGAGFDTTAYRTRDIRIVQNVPAKASQTDRSLIDGMYIAAEKRTNRYVKVMEIDLPSVQQKKLKVMRASMTPEEFQYYTEGVQFLACNFGVQSLSDVLMKNGFDPSQPSAFLWEGVTYYIPLCAVKATLGQINHLLTSYSTTPHRRSLSSNEKALITEGIHSAKSTTEEEIVSGSESVESGGLENIIPESYLLIDYMNSATTLLAQEKHDSWLWDLEQKLSLAIGTPFITGIENIDQLLSEYGFQTDMHLTREDCEISLKKAFSYTSVLFEDNSTLDQKEPHLAVASAFFRPFEI